MTYRLQFLRALATALSVNAWYFVRIWPTYFKKKSPAEYQAPVSPLYTAGSTAIGYYPNE